MKCFCKKKMHRGRENVVVAAIVNNNNNNLVLKTCITYTGSVIYRGTRSRVDQP